MTNDFDLDRRLAGQRLTWLVTGAAGFIGSNLVEALLKAGQNVVGFDEIADFGGEPALIENRPDRTMRVKQQPHANLSGSP